MNDQVRAMLRIPLTALTTARVICRKCQRGIIEVPIDRLDAALDHGQCRFCGHQQMPRSGPDPLNSLKLALADLGGNADLGIEFELQAPRPEAP